MSVSSDEDDIGSLKDFIEDDAPVERLAVPEDGPELVEILKEEAKSLGPLASVEVNGRTLRDRNTLKKPVDEYLLKNQKDIEALALKEEKQDLIDELKELQKEYKEKYAALVPQPEKATTKKSLEDIKRAAELDPNNLDINFNLCMVYLLLQLNFKEGWRCFEKRKEVQEFKEKTKSLNKIYLDHLPHTNDPILIYGEQGIGDQIIYLSLLHEIQKLPNKIYVQIKARVTLVNLTYNLR